MKQVNISLFISGWVEFAEKKIAKNVRSWRFFRGNNNHFISFQVALALNNTLIGGKKRSFYHDDIWNIKYLKGFKYAVFEA